MNTREENVAAAMGEAEEIAKKEQIRRADLQWAQEWREGTLRCPYCAGTDLDPGEIECDGRVCYQAFTCRGPECDAYWKVEFWEAAVLIVREDCEDDWIKLEALDEAPPVHLSERERAATLAALRYWRSEGPSSAGHEALSAEEIDGLCERIKRSTSNRSDSVNS